MADIQHINEHYFDKVNKVRTAIIKAIEYYLPVSVLTNETLSKEFPEWSISKIENKVGISSRHISSENEFASDLAVSAAKKLFDSGACSAKEIDYILLCTQSPDYLLPTTACLVQHQLNIPKTAGAVDINLGCSGYVYGLSIAKGLIESHQANNILFITCITGNCSSAL